VRKTYDAGVAQQQVEARHQHHEHQDLGRNAERLHARKDKGRERQRNEQRHQQQRQQAAAGHVVGEKSFQEHVVFFLNG